MSLSLIQKIKIWSDAAEGIREPIDDADLDSMARDLEAHIGEIYEYAEAVAEDAERLKAKANAFYDAAKLQEKKHERIKGFLKYAMQLNGFTKLKFGDLQMSLTEAKKAGPARPATELDFNNYPELVKPKLAWKSAPTGMQWMTYPDLVEAEFAWDLAKLKTEKPELIEYETQLRLAVKVNKK